MPKEYVEVFLSGDFDVVKGFVNGYLVGRGVTRRPFFHVKRGIIRHDTLIGNLRAFLEIRDHVPFCLDRDLLDDFREAVTVVRKRLGLEVVELKRVISAHMQIEHEIVNRDVATACKDLLSNLPDEIEVLEYEPAEEQHGEYPDLTMTSLAHSYTYRGSGVVRGDFEAVTDLFFAIKQSRCSDHIKISHLELNLLDYE